MVERHVPWGISLLYWNAVVVCNNAKRSAEKEREQEKRRCSTDRLTLQYYTAVSGLS